MHEDLEQVIEAGRRMVVDARPRLTNREVATQLFLSPKTIETHLGHVFRKTGVHTRAELAHRFRDSPDSIAAPAP